MRIVDIPPYRRAGVNYDPKDGHFMMKDLIAGMKARGQLDGVEIDIDEAEPTEHGAEARDDEVVANIAVGIIKRVKAVCAMGKYDAVSAAAPRATDSDPSVASNAIARTKTRFRASSAAAVIWTMRLVLDAAIGRR